MSLRTTPRVNRFLPQVAVATTLVVVVPSVIGWLLRDAGVVPSELTAVVVVVALSMLFSYLGGSIWRSRSNSGDLLFSELMVWGWLRRWWKERRLATVLLLLDGVDASGAAEEQDTERRTRLLIDLANALEARDPYTHGHSHRVARHAEMVGEAMGLSPHEVAKIRTAAALHDVGKVNTPAHVLHKPGRLTDPEFALIQQHSIDGADMVASLGDPQLTATIRQHHERLNGSGYPSRLSGEQICLGARIIAVADTFDAITSTRPYRAAMTHKQALQILDEEAGTKLDAEIVAAFKSYYWGRRPLALWVALTNLSGRLMTGFGGGTNATATSVTRVMTASALAGASAVSIGFPLLPPVRPSARSVAASRPARAVVRSNAITLSPSETWAPSSASLRDAAVAKRPLRKGQQPTAASARLHQAALRPSSPGPSITGGGGITSLSADRGTGGSGMSGGSSGASGRQVGPTGGTNALGQSHGGGQGIGSPGSSGGSSAGGAAGASSRSEASASVTTGGAGPASALGAARRGTGGIH